LTHEGCDVEVAKELETAIKWETGPNDTAAFIIEPIKGNGGHQQPFDPEYWKIVRETCDKYGVMLIDDEIQTGMGRTGEIWAADYFKFSPDIMTSAKALGGGMPVSATLIRSDLVEEKYQSDPWHIFTMGGSPVCMAAGIAAVDIMLEEKLPQQAKRQGERMTKRLKEIEAKHKLVGEVRGPGLFIGVELVKDKKTKDPAFDEAVQVFSKCLEKGVFFGLSAKAGYGNVIKIKPPLSITDAQADKAVDVLDEVLTEVERSL
jgi:4-aminobutyrate aminotransferase-like enzyme